MRDSFARQRKTNRIETVAYQCLHVLAGALFAGQQPFHLPAQFHVVVASIVQQARPLRRIALGCLVEQFFDLRPKLRSHAPPTPAASPDGAKPRRTLSLGALYSRKRPAP